MTHLQRAVRFVATHPDANRVQAGSAAWREIFLALHAEAKRKERLMIFDRSDGPGFPPLLFMGLPLELHCDLPPDAIR